MTTLTLIIKKVRFKVKNLELLSGVKYVSASNDEE